MMSRIVLLREESALLHRLAERSQMPPGGVLRSLILREAAQQGLVEPPAGSTELEASHGTPCAPSEEAPHA